MRHARYFAQVLGSAGDLFQTGGDALQESLALFDRERTNIIVGQRWAAAGTDASIEPAQLASRYTGAVSLVLNLRLHPRERIAWAEAALAANRRIGNRPGEGSALNDLGQAYADLGQTGKAIECYEQVLVIGREVGRELVGTPSVLAGLRAALFGAEMPETSNATKAARDSLARAPGAASANDRSAKCGLIPTYARSIHLAVC